MEKGRLLPQSGESRRRPTITAAAPPRTPMRCRRADETRAENADGKPTARGRREKIEPVLMQGLGTMRPIAAATRSGSTLLAGPTRAREPGRVWDGRLDTALQQIYAQRARLRCASLLAKSTYQLPVMRATYPERQRKPLSLRHLPGPSLRNPSDDAGKTSRLRQRPAVAGGVCRPNGRGLRQSLWMTVAASP